MKGGEHMKSQARWNKIYQKKLRKQQEREQQKKTDSPASKVSQKNKYLWSDYTMNDFNIIGRTYDDLMSDPEYHQYRTNLNEIDTTPENYNQDDFGQQIYREDWILIGYVNYHDVKRKFIITTDSLYALIEEYGADSIITNELEIISGEEWLKHRWMEERE